MDNIISGLTHFILQYPAWTHVILAAGILLQGEITVFAAVYLVVANSLSWGSFLLTTLGTVFVAETFMFFVGRFIRATRFGWRFSKRLKPNRRVQTYLYYLKTNMKRFFIVGKFLPGTNLLVILLAGWARTPFRAFLRSYLASLLLWFGSMTALAYLFASGFRYLSSTNILQHAEVGIPIVVILILIGEYFLRKTLQRAGKIEEQAEAIGRIVKEEFGDEESTVSKPIA